jgi:hypothetical protein
MSDSGARDGQRLPSPPPVTTHHPLLVRRLRHNRPGWVHKNDKPDAPAPKRPTRNLPRARDALGALQTRQRFVWGGWLNHGNEAKRRQMRAPPIRVENPPPQHPLPYPSPPNPPSFSRRGLPRGRCRGSWRWPFRRCSARRWRGGRRCRCCAGSRRRRRPGPAPSCPRRSCR